MSLLTILNEPQQQAVSAPPGHMLILAGAGSGKTRVLTHRIGWLMTEQGVSLHAILAVTFTNKAANEMRHRIESLIGYSMSSMWVGTFHGLAHRLLRSHWQEAGLIREFQILDADDQHRLIRRVMKAMNLDEDKWAPKNAQSYINHCKENGKRPHHLETHDYYSETMVQIYKEYEIVCANSGLVDFSELLLRTLELFQNHPEILQHYQNRFQHILVDEFQDTNAIQYLWLKTLTGKNSFMMAVGDDDQSIYSWRGARIENIHRFSQDFANAQLIRLEQNYRSTQIILSAANAVIENNTGRLGKQLWTEGNTGERITIYSGFNERDEADYIIAAIQQWCQQPDHSYQDIAILYRSNAQSRVLEEHLISARIPYRIYGGLKFFDRAEIKDAIGYLRLLINRNDDSSFERVVNLPTRGIGNTTLTALRDLARTEQCSLWNSALYHIEHKLLSARALSALQNFITLINKIDEETKLLSLEQQCEYVLQHSGLKAHYNQSKSQSDLSRSENLDELISAMSQFTADANMEELSPLQAFLAHVALEAGETQAEPHTKYVYLMTLHAAKGLEFPMVIIAGMEENLFPHRMSMEDPSGVEEERRLCYVGMTRARQKLYFTHAEFRRLHGIEKMNKPSRFLEEIPSEFLQRVRPQSRVSRPVSTSRISENHSGFQIGQRVRHPSFGVGILTDFEGYGEHARVQVQFELYGTKWLIANMAKLEVC